MHVVLFDQEITLDAPAIAGGQVAALMNVRAIERAAGDPGMFARRGHDLVVLIHLFPLLVADDDMDIDMSAGVGAVFLANVVGPTKVLATLAPVLSVRIVGLEVNCTGDTRRHHQHRQYGRQSR